MLVPAAAIAADFDPLPTYNQSPLVQIFGLPAPDSAHLLAPHQWQARVTLEMANNFVAQRRNNESLTLDGETHRAAMTLKYGTTAGEWGIEIPYVTQSGGFLDAFITNWHDVFGLPAGGRNDVAFDQLRYTYQRDSITRLNITEASRGIGDIRLLGAWPVTAFGDVADVALRSSVKLPTGDPAALQGSGAADLALWISTECAARYCPGAAGWNLSLGALVLGRGDVLPDLQRRFVAFGGAGFAWRAGAPIVLKAELRAHSSFYNNTSIDPLGSTAAQLILGGTWYVDRQIAVDIGVSEDIRVDTGPDVSLLISLRAQL